MPDAFTTEANKLLDSLPGDDSAGGEVRAATRRLIAHRLEDMAAAAAAAEASAAARTGSGSPTVRPFRQFLSEVWSVVCLVSALALLARVVLRDSAAGESQCLVSWDSAIELARRPSNCTAMCAGLTQVPVETNLTVDRFMALYAYTGRPVLVKGAARDWRALDYFNYTFIRDLHDRHPSAYGDGRNVKVIDPFNVELATLREALHMSEERRRRPFYFGWKNLNRGVFKELMDYHERPRYLGPEIEHPAADWFYIGSASRAALPHIDFFSRPSWQAQISGRKRWLLEPPVECENECAPLQVDIEAGDILNVDPNQWYHSTFVLDGTFSITLGSEYM